MSNETARERQTARDSFAMMLRASGPLAAAITVETPGRFTVRVFTEDDHAAHAVEIKGNRARSRDVTATELQPHGYSIVIAF